MAIFDDRNVHTGAENYRPKDIVKYRHLSPSGDQALEVSAARMEVTVSAAKMWFTIFIVIMQMGVSVAIMQVGFSAVHYANDCFYCN